MVVPYERKAGIGCTINQMDNQLELDYSNLPN